MSSPRPRKPAIFSPDDPNVVVTAAKDDPLLDIVTGTEAEPQLPALTSATKQKRGWPWRKILFGAVGGLVSLGIGLAVTRLIEDLFARFEALWLACAGAGRASDCWPCLRLSRANSPGCRALPPSRNCVSARRRHWSTIIAPKARRSCAICYRSKAGRRIWRRSRAKLQAHLGEIIDGADLIRLGRTRIDDTARPRGTPAREQCGQARFDRRRRCRRVRPSISSSC